MHLAVERGDILELEREAAGGVVVEEEHPGCSSARREDSLGMRRPWLTGLSRTGNCRELCFSGQGQQQQQQWAIGGC